MKRILSMILVAAMLSAAMLVYSAYAEKTEGKETANKAQFQERVSLEEVSVSQSKSEALPWQEYANVADFSEAKATLGSGAGAANLIDGKKKGGYQMIPEGENCYAVLDLGKEYPVRNVAVYTYDYNYGFNVQGSVDGVHYVTLGANAASEEYDADVGYRVEGYDGRYRYIRVNGTAGRYGYFSLYEIEVFSDETLWQTAPDEQLHEVSVPPHTSATLGSGQSSSKLIDGKISIGYQMISDQQGCYVDLDLGSVYGLEKVTVYTYNYRYGFNVQGSVDGVHFVPLGINAISDDYNSGEGYTIYVSGEFRYLRVEGVVLNYGYLSLYEIDVFSKTPPPKRGDLNGDHLINVSDLNDMLVLLATYEENARADLDGDGVISVADLNELLVILATDE